MRDYRDFVVCSVPHNPVCTQTGLSPVGKRREKSRLVTSKAASGLNPPGW